MSGVGFIYIRADGKLHLHENISLPPFFVVRAEKFHSSQWIGVNSMRRQRAIENEKSLFLIFQFIQGPPSIEYLLFGSGPLLLHLQALITCESIGRYRLLYIIAPFLGIFVIDCACSITISAVYFTLLFGLLSFRLFFP